MFRNICFTLHNYTDEERESLKNNLLFTYVIIGKELGEDKITPHLQGYGELTTQSRLKTVKTKLGINRIHIEERRGKQQEAIDYCKKENNWIERGKAKDQGIRKDLDLVRRLALDNGMRAVVLVASKQQIEIAKETLTYWEDARDWKPYVYWFWGAGGTGKSKTAEELLGEEAYIKADGAKWWPGYDGHELVIIDDFRDYWWDITVMLGLLGRGRYRVECKGSYRQFKAKIIVVTSPKHPKDCYSNSGEEIYQLLRRIDCIWRAQ